MDIELSDVCTECGEIGTMELVDSETRQIGGFGYNDEPDYEVLSITERCRNCGYQQDKGANYDPDSAPGGHDDY